jgi:hypothetical protein
MRDIGEFREFSRVELVNTIDMLLDKYGDIESIIEISGSLSLRDRYEIYGIYIELMELERGIVLGLMDAVMVRELF